MLTWLSKNSTSRRRAARAAAPVVRAKPQAAPEVEEELPPPFFADSDPAFLDMGEEEPRTKRVEEVPVQVVAPVVEMASAKRGRVAQALLALPTFPERDQPDRMRQLLAIYRSLDRIAADAIRSGV